METALLQQAPLIISIMALFVAACSLAVAALGYRRDRAKVKAWSIVAWHEQGLDERRPHLHVFAANVGRRPVSLLDLVKHAGRSTWSARLKEPVIDQQSISGTHELLVKLREGHISHSAAVKLTEGDVYEVVFPVEQMTWFFATHEAAIPMAKRLSVTDVAGNRFPVKGSAKHLRIMFDAFHESMKAADASAISAAAQPADVKMMSSSGTDVQVELTQMESPPLPCEPTSRF